MDFEIRDLDKKYWPKSLLELPQKDLPKQLRIRGINPDWSEKRICIIGSRKFSDYGEKVCQKIIEGFSNLPITIISGLAYGIDSLTHRFALNQKLKVIAIPGSGLKDEVIYPKRHLDLAQKILAEGGCLISEYNDYQEAKNWTFPKRNRIMASLSDLVLIIEAGEKSGTMITARLALDYNIDVACIPGSIFAENSKGTNRLIKEGAHPVCDAEDILELLEIKKTELKSTERLEKILTPSELKIFNLLKNPLTKEELFKSSGLKIQDLNQIISILEINNLIEFLENKICQK